MNYPKNKKHPQGVLDAIDRMVANYTKSINNDIINKIIIKNDKQRHNKNDANFH